MVEEKKKNAFQKLKEGLDDKEEQLAIISLFVRLGVVVWSGFIVTLNYISIPGYSSEPKDITFPASLLTGALATFGLEGSKKSMCYIPNIPKISLFDLPFDLRLFLIYLFG